MDEGSEDNNLYQRLDKIEGEIKISNVTFAYVQFPPRETLDEGRKLQPAERHIGLSPNMYICQLSTYLFCP